jgi:predicted RecB family endonuclease
MAATPEGRVKKQVVEVLKREGVYYFYPVTGGFGRSGVCDIICCLNGRFFGIECKAGTNKPTALQEAEMARIRLAGGKTLVVNETNLNEVKELVAWIKKQPQEN